MVLWFGHMMESLRSNWEKGDEWVDADGVVRDYDGRVWKERRDEKG